MIIIPVNEDLVPQEQPRVSQAQLLWLQQTDGGALLHWQPPQPFSGRLPSILSPTPIACGLCQLHSRQCHSIFAALITVAKPV